MYTEDEVTAMVEAAVRDANARAERLQSQVEMCKKTIQDMEEEIKRHRLVFVYRGEKKKS